MKHLQLIATLFFVSVASFGMGFIAHEPKTIVVETPVFGGVSEDLVAEKAKKVKIMSGYFEAKERLKETPTVDLSQGTAEEWTQAYVDLANKLAVKIDSKDNLNAVSVKIKNKLQADGKMCK